MIFWLGTLSIIFSLFLSFSKLFAGFFLSLLATIVFKIEKRKELFIFSLLITIAILIKILSNAIIPIILSIVIALIFLPLVNYLEYNYKIPRILSSIFFVLISLGIISLSIYYISNILISEFQKIYQNLANLYNSLPENIKSEIDNYFKNFHYDVSQFLNIIGSTISISFYLIVGIVLSLYLLADYKSILKLLSKKFDISGLEYVIEILGKYIRAQLTMALIVGIMIFLLCTIFSIKYSHIIGIIAGFFNLIPNVGFIITITITGLITLAVSDNILIDFIKLSIIFTIDQIIETTILTPRIMGQTFKIEPTIVITALIASSALFGIWGFFIAIPSAVLIRNLLFYTRD